MNKKGIDNDNENKINTDILKGKICKIEDRNAAIFISEDNIFENEKFKPWKHHFVKKPGSEKNLKKVRIGNKSYTIYPSNFTNYVTKNQNKKKQMRENVSGLDDALDFTQLQNILAEEMIFHIFLSCKDFKNPNWFQKSTNQLFKGRFMPKQKIKAKSFYDFSKKRLNCKKIGAQKSSSGQCIVTNINRSNRKNLRTNEVLNSLKEDSIRSLVENKNKDKLRILSIDIDNFKKPIIEIYEDGSKGKGKLSQYDVHKIPITDTKNQTEYFIEQIDEIIKADADIICFQGFSDLSINNKSSEIRSSMKNMSSDKHKKYVEYIIQQKNWVKWFLEQEGYKFLEEINEPAPVSLIGIPAPVSLIGILQQNGGNKGDRYSGLAICYKEQMGNGRSIFIKKTIKKTNIKKAYNNLKFVQHVSVNISDQDRSKQIKFEIININKIDPLLTKKDRNIITDLRLDQIVYDEKKSIMMVGDVPNLIRRQDRGPYDLRSSFQILERTGKKASSGNEIFITPFTTKNIQLLEKDDKDPLVKQYHIFNSCPVKNVLVCSDTEKDRKKNKAWKWTGTDGTAKPTNTFIYYTRSCANYAIITDFSLPTDKSNISKIPKKSKWIGKTDFQNDKYLMSGGISKTNSIFRVPYKLSKALVDRNNLIKKEILKSLVVKK